LIKITPVIDYTTFSIKKELLPACHQIQNMANFVTNPGGSVRHPLTAKSNANRLRSPGSLILSRRTVLANMKFLILITLSCQGTF
jgi:hypothetical protein